MRNAVKTAWFNNIVGYEGFTTWMYFDTHQPPLCTTGVGHMIDSGTGLTKWGMGLGWKTKSGRKATDGEINEEYKRLKALKLKGSGFAYEAYARLYLDKGVVQWMTDTKRDEFFSILGRYFPKIDTWPADAQLAIMNMAWWMGPAFAAKWPNLTKALQAGNFLDAADHCQSKDKTKRDADDRRLFVNAAKVWASGSTPNVLWNKEQPTFQPFTSATSDMATSLSLRAVTKSGMGQRTLPAWYVQRMLTIEGFYKSTLDGLWGPVSKDAYGRFCKTHKMPEAITSTSLSKLVKVSQCYLKVVA